MTSEPGPRIRPALRVERLATGIPRLDQVLDGGLRVGSMIMAMGRPGTGKTTFGNQLCFAQAQQGRRSVYVTLLAESHASMLQNLEHMTFFDASRLENGVTYLGAYDAMRQRKLEGLLQVLRQVIQDEAPDLMVIDGVGSTRQAGEALEQKEFFAELGVLSALSRCTTILLANMTPEEANGPEHTMVDALIDLSMERSANRCFRTLRVLKCRGGRQILGANEMVISRDGITVFPNAEELYTRERREISAYEGRVATGVDWLDQMLGGGVLEGSLSMLLGYTGSGKTSLGTEFLHAGAKRKEKGLHFGFYEAPERLTQTARAAGVDLAADIQSGLVDIIWQSPEQHGLDALAARLMENIERREVRRVFIDGLDGFRQASFPQHRDLPFLTAIGNALRARNVTTLMTQETVQLAGPKLQVQGAGYSALAENIIALEFIQGHSGSKRLLSIVKQRASATNRRQCEFVLDEKGFHIVPFEEGDTEGESNIGATRGRRGASGSDSR